MIFRKTFPFGVRQQSLCDYLNNIPSIDSEVIAALNKALDKKKLGDPTLDLLVEVIENRIRDRRVELNQERYDLTLTKNHRQFKLDQVYWPKLKTWIDANVKPGLLLKMTGCRDGVGLREVIGIQGDLISCYKLELPRLPWKGDPDRSHQIPIRSQVTDHHWKKVLGPAQLMTPEYSSKQRNRFTYTSLRKTL